MTFSAVVGLTNKKGIYFRTLHQQHRRVASNLRRKVPVLEKKPLPIEIGQKHYSNSTQVSLSESGEAELANLWKSLNIHLFLFTRLELVTSLLYLITGTNYGLSENA